MSSDCYIKIGQELHEGLDAATLLAGIRSGQPVEICFQGCSNSDRRLLTAFYEKWRQDTNPWHRYRLALVVGAVLLSLGLAYAVGYADMLLSLLSLLTHEDPSGDDSSFFADKVSLNTFIFTVTLILGVIALFVRRLAARSAAERAGTRLRDNEASSRLAKGYDLTMSEDRLLMTPRPR